MDLNLSSYRLQFTHPEKVTNMNGGIDILIIVGTENKTKCCVLFNSLWFRHEASKRKSNQKNQTISLNSGK